MENQNETSNVETNVNTGETPAVAETTTVDAGSLLGQAKNDIINNGDNEIETEPETETKETEQEIEYTDFVIPKGVEINNELLDSFKSIAKELKLTQEQAQKLVDLQINEIQRIDELNKKAFNEARLEYQKEVKKMYGDKLDNELSYGAKAIDNLLSKEEAIEFREFLNISGLGDNPQFVKMLVDVGKLISEDKIVIGVNNNSKKSDADILFGDFNKK